MNVRILKIPPVFDDPKVFSKGNVVFDEASILHISSLKNGRSNHIGKYLERKESERDVIW